jgi:hypothetical protein
MPGLELRGREAMRTATRDRTKIQRTSRHVITNLSVTPDGENHARSRGIQVVYRHDGPNMGSTVPKSVFDFEDRYQRTENGWQILERRLTRIFIDPSQRSG